MIDKGFGKTMKLEDICDDFENWPESWAGDDEDVEPSVRMVNEVFLPFFEQLVDIGLTRKTIRKHIDNIWSLGGEIVRSFYFEEEDLRSKTARELVLMYVTDNEGPLLSHGQSGAEQRSFDSSCKKLFKFLTGK